MVDPSPPICLDTALTLATIPPTNTTTRPMYHQPHSRYHLPQSPPLYTTNYNHLPKSPPLCSTCNYNYMPQSTPPYTTNHIYHITSHNHDHTAPPITFNTSPPTITNTMPYQPQSPHHLPQSPPLCAPPITFTTSPPTITTTMHHQPQSPYQNLQSQQPCTTIHNHSQHNVRISTPPDAT